MPQLLTRPEAAEDQTKILRAFVTLMTADSRPDEAHAALDLLTVAAQDGTILDAVKTIARG